MSLSVSRGQLGHHPQTLRRPALKRPLDHALGSASPLKEQAVASGFSPRLGFMAPMATDGANSLMEPLKHGQEEV